MNPLVLMASWPGRIAALVIVGVLAGGGVFVARAQQPAAKPDLRTTTVARGSVTQTVSVSGSVSAQGQARLSFKSAGRLAQVYVSVGQTVTQGQPLAKLDTTDLETALSTAQQNLANAQASYQKQVLAANDTRKSLEDTQRSTANDIATAQQALNKLKTSYASAKSNFTSLATQVRTDAAALQSSIDTLRTNLNALLSLMSTLVQTSDVRNATNSLNQALVALNNAGAYSTSLLTPSLADFGGAQALLLTTVQSFDDGFAAGRDTTSVAGTFQAQQLGYSTAATRLQGAIDVVTGPIGTAQTSAAAAQTTLNSVNSVHDALLDGARDSLQQLLVLISQQTQNASVAKSRIGQAGSALATVGDSVQGALLAAHQSLQATTDRSATSVRNAQLAVANIPFNLQSAQVSVDNAQNAVATAQANLDNAVLTAPAAGIVASVANQVGEFVQGGNTNSAFMVLTNTAQMVLHGTVGEADVAKLKLGQVANVSVDALSGQRMTGKVVSLDPVATISQGVPVYGIDVAIDVPATTLKAGMSGTASVILASKQNVLTVPNTSIRTVNGQRGVQVLRGGEVVDTAVTFGIANDTVTEIVSGLAEGDTVVIPQARAAASGQPQRGAPGQGGQVFIGR